MAYLNGIDLESIGIIITRETKVDLLPGRKDRKVNILGRHGSILIPGKLKERSINLVMVLSAETDEQFFFRRELIASQLDPTKTCELILDDDLDKIYRCRCIGEINLSEWIRDAKMEVPLRMADPYIYSHEKAGAGSGVIINTGSEKTHISITIQGPAFNPSISIGGTSVVYNGVLTHLDRLQINGVTMEYTLNGQNVLHNITGDIPMLVPGNNSIANTTGIMTYFWRERWIV